MTILPLLDFGCVRRSNVISVPAWRNQPPARLIIR